MRFLNQAVQMSNPSKRPYRAFVGIVVLCMAPWFASHGQAPSALQEGQRIRVTVPTMSLRRASGTLVRLGTDTMQLETKEAVLAIPRTEITRLDVSRGQKSAAGKGLKWGLLSGALVGAVVSGIVCATNTCQFIEGDADRPGVWIPIGAGLGAAGGALVGVMIGSSSHTERWERLSTDPTTSFYAGYARTGVQLGVRHAW